MHDLRKDLLSIAALFVIAFPTHAQTGIANKYDRDQGIGNDPSVIFSDNFEGGHNAIISNWTTSDSNAITQVSDVPTASGGARSIRLVNPGGSSGTLYKRLARDCDVVFLRYYVKYSGTGYHHTGGYLGGYYPPTNWPQGDAGLKGIRPNGDKLINIGLETQPLQGTRLDFYANWVDMRGSAWQGQYYGRNLVTDHNVPIRTGNWQCIEFMIKMNSAPNTFDGELALWVDGQLIEHFRPGAPNGYWSQNGSWVNSASSPAFGGFLWRDTLNFGLNWVKLQNYDDNGGPTDAWFDDLVVATEYIGPLNTGGPVVTLPPSPTNLRVVP